MSDDAQEQERIERSDDGEPKHGAKESRVLDAGALRALAHPLRVQIYDILSQYGPQTASSLAARLGESSGATSYHLRALAAHDLIREVEGRGTGRERWWERPKGGVSFPDPEAMRTPSGRAATQLVMAEFLRRRQQQLLDYVNRGITTESDVWKEGSLISTSTARMTAEQSQKLAEDIQDLINAATDEYRDQQGEGVRPVTIRADLFPLPDEPLPDE